MNPETIDRIEEALKPLADVAGQGAEYAWTVLVRQMYLSGIVRIPIGLLILVLAALFAFFCAHNFKKWRKAESWHESENYGAGTAVTAALGIISLIVAVAVIAGGVLRMMNPGYYALEELTRMVGL